MGDLTAFKLMSHIAEAEGLAVVRVVGYRALVESGVYDGAVWWPPKGNLKIPFINLSDRLSPQVAGIILAHELGHVLDWRQSPTVFVARQAVVNTAFRAALRDPKTDRIHPKIGKLILEIEESAWLNARQLASEATHWVGRPVDWDLWERVQTYALDTYRRDIRCAIKGGTRERLPDLSDIDPQTKTVAEAMR